MVAKLEHFTRAAEELYVAQPSLSRAIARLEEELGVDLFDRQGRQVRLNRFGRFFLHRVERVLHELEVGKQELADIVGTERGEIGLVFQHTIGVYVLPDMLQEFLSAHPAVTFRLAHTSTAPILRQLREGEFDLCISSLPFDRKQLQATALMTEEIFLAVSSGHRLAARKHIQLKEVADEPFIAMKRGYSLRDIGDELCRKAGFEPKIAFEGDEMPTVRGLAAAGLGVALIPALGWQGVVEPAPVRLHITDPICERTIWLSWDEEHYLSAVTRLFREFVKDYFTQLEGRGSGQHVSYP